MELKIKQRKNSFINASHFILIYFISHSDPVHEDILHSTPRKIKFFMLYSITIQVDSDLIIIIVIIRRRFEQSPSVFPTKYLRSKRRILFISFQIAKESRSSRTFECTTLLMLLGDIITFCSTVLYLSFLYDCMVNIKLKYHFVETPRKFIIAELSIRKLGSSSVPIIIRHYY